ncbi:hypothetical protein N7495_008746 [Penicillium taxi]|uniref:uncharacterized protein n=1 Tax=Penicillium taxi TaxID=168475 RepID=UPI0025454DF9|nr:uncharacterized protein N7495_008746 [Penicillium taxi]KAJ5888705.1 hypothetical protein N7495_008746 [Penicillium taxi]
MSARSQNGQASEGTVKPSDQKETLKTKERKSSVRWSIGLIVRLCIWYTLLTPFLRCPSNLSNLHDASPRVCKPYLIARSHVDPYVTPYYDTYAAPYVNQARPYVEVFNQKVYQPVLKTSRTSYEKYGASVLQQAQEYGAFQWNAQVSPRMQIVQDKAYQLYLVKVDPYIKNGVAIVEPYYQLAQKTAITVYWDHLVPFYTRSQPFIGKTYSTGHKVLTTHVLPSAHYTWSSVIYFANSSLWPHVTGLYSEQVEPQLVKIGQRLASYREGRRLRGVVEDIDSTLSEQSSTASSSSEKSILISSVTTTTKTSVVGIPSVEPTLSPAEKAEQERKRIDSDLQRWQSKFAAAADKGVEDLEARIEELVGALVANSAKSHGRSLSTALETVAAEQVSVIKSRIHDLVQTLPEEEALEAEESARSELVDVIRSSAIAVRDRTHALREWSLSFEDELSRRVSAAVNSTLDVLDSIRDLGLQEIGARWAWMDGVTYKDWTKYHALKAQLDDWRNEIREVALNQKSVAEARAVATEILDNGMEIAEDTAKEIMRLRDVGSWKFAARELSDNFDTRTEAPPPRRKLQVEFESDEDIELDDSSNAHDNAHSDESSEPSDPTPDEIHETPELNIEDVILTRRHVVSIEDDESILSDEVDEIEHHKPATSYAWGVSAADANILQEPIIDDEDHAVLSSIESVYSGAVQYVTDELSSQIDAITATPTPTAPLAQISSIASSRLSEGLSLASEKLAHIQPIATEPSSFGQQPFVLDAQRRYYEAVGLAHEHYTAFVSTASKAVYGTPTPTPFATNAHNLLREAGSQYNWVSSQASASLAAVIASASSAVSSADDGKAQSIIDDASSRYHAALSAASSSLSLASASASSAIYGTTPGPLEALSSQASENWENLVSKASEQIYGTPEPYLQQIVDYQYPKFEAVHDIISELLVGKQPSYTESVISKLRAAYETPYPASAVSSVSSLVHEAYETASSVANSYAPSIPSSDDIIKNANDQLNAAVEAASIGIYGTQKGSYEKATEAVSRSYATASAHVSIAMYGKESSYIDIAKEAIEDIQAKASAAIYGEEPGAIESATGRLAVAVENAQSRLADLASSATSVVSEAAETAVSYVEDATSSIKAAVSVEQDEL